MKFNSRIRLLLSVIVLLSLGGGAWYWQQQRAKASPLKDAVVKVFQASEVTQAQLQALSGQIDMSGTLVASESRRCWYSS